VRQWGETIKKEKEVVDKSLEENKSHKKLFRHLVPAIGAIRTKESDPFDLFPASAPNLIEKYEQFPHDDLLRKFNILQFENLQIGFYWHSIALAFSKDFQYKNGKKQNSEENQLKVNIQQL